MGSARVGRRKFIPSSSSKSLLTLLAIAMLASSSAHLGSLSDLDRDSEDDDGDDNEEDQEEKHESGQDENDVSSSRAKGRWQLAHRVKCLRSFMLKAVPSQPSGQCVAANELKRDASYQQFIQQVLSSRDLMKDTTVFRRELLTPPLQGDDLDQQHLLNIATKVVHEVKVSTAHACWLEHLTPARTELESVCKKHRNLDAKFKETRMMYLQEISLLRDQKRIRGDPGRDLSTQDVKWFYEPTKTLTEEEREYLLIVLHEKLKMMFDANPSVTRMYDFGQIDRILQETHSDELEKSRTVLGNMRDRVKVLEKQVASQAKQCAAQQQQLAAHSSDLKLVLAEFDAFQRTVSGCAHCTGRMSRGSSPSRRELEEKVEARKVQLQIETLQRERDENSATWQDQLVQKRVLQGSLHEYIAATEVLQQEGDAAKVSISRAYESNERLEEHLAASTMHVKTLQALLRKQLARSGKVPLESHNWPCAELMGLMAQDLVIPPIQVGMQRASASTLKRKSCVSELADTCPRGQEAFQQMSQIPGAAPTMGLDIEDELRDSPIADEAPHRSADGDEVTALHIQSAGTIHNTSVQGAAFGSAGEADDVALIVGRSAVPSNDSQPARFPQPNAACATLGSAGETADVVLIPGRGVGNSNDSQPAHLLSTNAVAAESGSASETDSVMLIPIRGVVPNSDFEPAHLANGAHDTHSSPDDTDDDVYDASSIGRPVARRHTVASSAHLGATVRRLSVNLQRVEESLSNSIQNLEDLLVDGSDAFEHSLSSAEDWSLQVMSADNEMTKLQRRRWKLETQLLVCETRKAIHGDRGSNIDTRSVHATPSEGAEVENAAIPQATDTVMRIRRLSVVLADCLKLQGLSGVHPNSQSRECEHHSGPNVINHLVIGTHDATGKGRPGRVIIGGLLRSVKKPSVIQELSLSVGEQQVQQRCPCRLEGAAEPKGQPGVCCFASAPKKYTG